MTLELNEDQVLFLERILGFFRRSCPAKSEIGNFARELAEYIKEEKEDLDEL